MKFLEERMLTEVMKEKHNQASAIRKMIMAILHPDLALNTVFNLPTYVENTAVIRSYSHLDLFSDVRAQNSKKEIIAPELYEFINTFIAQKILSEDHIKKYRKWVNAKTINECIRKAFYTTRDTNQRRTVSSTPDAVRNIN